MAIERKITFFENSKNDPKMCHLQGVLGIKNDTFLQTQNP